MLVVSRPRLNMKTVRIRGNKRCKPCSLLGGCPCGPKNALSTLGLGPRNRPPRAPEPRVQMIYITFSHLDSHGAHPNNRVQRQPETRFPSRVPSTLHCALSPFNREDRETRCQMIPFGHFSTPPPPFTHTHTHTPFMSTPGNKVNHK